MSTQKEAQGAINGLYGTDVGGRVFVVGALQSAFTVTIDAQSLCGTFSPSCLVQLHGSLILCGNGHKGFFRL